jgi:hypothetical protein
VNITRASSGCGSHHTTLVPAGFNLTSGEATYHEKLSVTACANQSGFVQREARIGVAGLRFAIPSDGWYGVSARWSLGLVFSFTTTNTTTVTTAKSHWGQFQVGSELQVEDLATGKIWNVTTVAFSVNSSAGVRGGSVGGYDGSFFRGLHLRASHTYLLETYVVLEVSASVTPAAPPGLIETAEIQIGLSHIKSETILHYISI